jgi:hypothetical protein
MRQANQLDYDGDFGIVLNRFLMQAAVQYPLTVIFVSYNAKCLRCHERTGLLGCNRFFGVHRSEPMTTAIIVQVPDRIDAPSR